MWSGTSCKNIIVFRARDMKKNGLSFARVAIINSLATNKPVALWFPIKLEFRNVSFCGGWKAREPKQNPSEREREPTTNSTHIWRRVQESNPGHNCGKWVLSPQLCHSCSPVFLLFVPLFSWKTSSHLHETLWYLLPNLTIKVYFVHSQFSEFLLLDMQGYPRKKVGEVCWVNK